MANIGGKVYPSTAESRNRQRNSTAESRNRQRNRLESEINTYKQKLSERDLEIERLRCKSDRLELDNKDLKQCLSEREKEIEELKETSENDKEVYKKHLFSKHKEIEKLKSKIKELEIQVKQNREEHDDLKRKTIEYENKHQEYLEVISTSRDEKSRLTSELQKRVTENEKMRETFMEQQEKIREHETTLEKMRMVIEKYKRLNKSILTNNVEKEDRITDLSKQLTNVKRDKENAENQIDSLSNTLFHKKKELESVQNKLARSEEDIKDIQASKRLADEKLQGLQTENDSLQSALSKATHEIEDFVNRGTNLQKYKTVAEHKASKLMNALREKDTENEVLREQLARAEKNVSILSKDIKDMQASKRQVAEEKLQSLQTENNSLKSALSKATNESEENVSILSKDINNIQESKRQVPDEKLQDLQTENDSLKQTLAEATTKIDDLWNKCTHLQKYKSDTELEIRTLLNTVEEKETEIETLHKHLARSEKNVSILSKDIKDIQGSKHQAADERLQSLQTENASIKLELAKATTEMDAFRNECTDLQKYKTDTEHTINTLLNAVKEKETKFETLNKQLARSEENVSIISKDIKNIQESKRQVADEKLQDLQTENDSLKLTLAEATTKIDDLCNKCTNLQKYKSDTELEIGTLLNAVEEKETEIETLHKHLARSEKNVSILSKDIKEIQGSKRQAADERVQSLQTENASIKLELAKATTENDAFRNKCTDLQKYKTDTEHTINTLLNAVKEKETEFETLNKQLTSYDQKGRHSNEAKRERNHNLKWFNSEAEEDGDSDPEHTGLM